MHFAFTTASGRLKAVTTFTALLMGLSTGQAFGQVPLLDTSDTVIGIDATGQTARSSYPGQGNADPAEGPRKLLDGLTNTKYLNFGHQGAGFIVTPTSPTAVQSFRITTGNDSPGRDPGTWQLYGYNGALSSTDNSSGLAETWTLIDQGAANLPGDPTINNDQRGVAGPLTAVNSGGTVYEHYKMVFPQLKDLSRANSMQAAEVQMFSDPAGAAGVLTPTTPVLAVHYGFESRYPFNERPAQALDQNPGTKYLNFGEENAGLIITNSGGAVRVDQMRLTTAGDAPERDPASYQLFGTNDAIQSLDHQDGLGGETWTLISEGPLSLSTDRGASQLVDINASSLYSSYKLLFPTVRNAGTANSMQIADVQFFTVPEPSAVALGLGGLALLLRRRGR